MNNLQVTSIRLICEGCEPVSLPRRPRFHYAPVTLAHGKDHCQVQVEVSDPDAEVELNGVSLKPDSQSPSFNLAYGKTTFTGTVATSDQTCTFSFKVIRSYPAPGWEEVTHAVPWLPRDSSGELVFKDRMWLFGGFTPEMVNDIWSSADGETWTHESDLPSESGIDRPIAFVYRERMWVTDVIGNLYASADGKEWDCMCEDAPWKGRNSAGAVVFKERMWVMGGSQDGQLLNDVWSSSDGETWALEVGEASWSRRQISHTPLVLNGRIFLLGGGALAPDYHPFVAWNDVWSSADGVHWEQVVDHAAWPSRIWGTALVFKNRLWMTGGFRSEPVWENLGDVWYSTDGVDWRQLVTTPAVSHSGSNNAPFPVSGAVWEPRHEHSAYALGDDLWVVGGMVWPLMNDVWRLNIEGACFTTQPVIEIYEGGVYEYQAHADFNLSCRPLNYRLSESPKWLSVDSETGLLRGVAGQAEDCQVCLEADDGDEAASQRFTLHVLPLA